MTARPVSKKAPKSNKAKKETKKTGIAQITKGSIRRLARRGGCKRVAANVYDEARAVLQRFVSSLMKDSFALLAYGTSDAANPNGSSKVKTVKLSHVLYALKSRGRQMYVA
eukprot:TRINITY_DN25030_c0_g1_i6.p4 TRINITY_DN25030_c0_g1~~TRINITY_DN25030_c0_g1_i6.p4  ORF type:complete len:111 (+),score=31.84 TRINITY_DN25030_c0_g1_i6:68-400(+)